MNTQDRYRDSILSMRRAARAYKRFLLLSEIQGELARRAVFSRIRPDVSMLRVARCEALIVGYRQQVIEFSDMKEMDGARHYKPIFDDLNEMLSRIQAAKAEAAVNGVLRANFGTAPFTAPFEKR
ncbi:hypothetical protein [Rhodoferax sp. PAMC 29310]|uniref:hypothetical protein n=1 Tax=Rhodoferax sp. PAMC 29310 TaxID=2822760 RepID=UPI001B343A6A|nr:hypothetical protein [Rhodoferax sp. PAMC 29310]